MGPWPSERLRRGLLGLGQGGPRGAANGCLFCPEDPAVRGRLTECLEAILNKAQEPPKSKKVQHSNAKNAVLFEAISLVTHHDRWAPLSLPPPHGHAPRQVGRAQPPPSTHSWVLTGGPRSASTLHTQLGAVGLALSLVIHHDRWATLSLRPPHTAGCPALASPGGSPCSWASHPASRSQGHPGTRVSVCPTGCVGQGCGRKVCAGRAGWGGGVSRSQQVHPPECHGSTDWALLASSPAGGCTSLGCVGRAQTSRGQNEKRAKTTPPNPGVRGAGA